MSSMRRRSRFVNEFLWAPKRTNKLSMRRNWTYYCSILIPTKDGLGRMVDLIGGEDWYGSQGGISMDEMDEMDEMRCGMYWYFSSLSCVLKQ